MKKIVVSVVGIIACLSTYAWGDLGHAAVGKVAQDHLTPKAAKAVAKYLGGLPLSAIATDADKYRGIWVMDLGFEPTNSDYSRQFASDFDMSLPLNFNPWSHSMTVDKEFKPYLTDNIDGEYINNIVYYVEILSEKLKNEADSMTPEECYRTVCLITHFLGDMHCPVHIVYRGVNEKKGGFKITYNDKKYSYHTFWDGPIFAFQGWGYMELAYAIDSASDKEIKQITEGNVRDWAEDSARKSIVIYDMAHSGEVLPRTFPFDARPLLYSQLRNAGYRLAALLNEIFK